MSLKASVNIVLGGNAIMGDLLRGLPGFLTLTNSLSS